MDWVKLIALSTLNSSSYEIPRGVLFCCALWSIWISGNKFYLSPMLTLEALVKFTVLNAVNQIHFGKHNAAFGFH